MDSGHEELRRHITWGEQYRPEWDDLPDYYAEAGVVQWGRSRRLGLFQLAAFKAYLGVQHIDPSRPGWGFVDEAQTRFFVSMFVGGRVVALRTFPTMGLALDALLLFLRTTRSSG